MMNAKRTKKDDIEAKYNHSDMMEFVIVYVQLRLYLFKHDDVMAWGRFPHW